MKALFTVAAFVILLGSFVFAGNPGSHNSNMKCGECIYYGYNSCINDVDHKVFTDQESYDSGNSNYNLCFRQSDVDTRYSYPSWTCSNSYNNSLYANYMCPQQERICSNVTEVTLPEIGSTGNISLSSLGMGDTCYYKVRTACGILKTNVTLSKTRSNGGRDTVHVDFIELSDKAVMLGDQREESNLGGAPAEGMPLR